MVRNDMEELFGINNSEVKDRTKKKRTLPPKKWVLAYIIWCAVNMFLAVYSLISDGWSNIGERLFPFGQYGYELREYDLTELVIYCGIPLLVYWIYRTIERKYYSD